ncbi:Uncharacterised protein [Achromobacter sp. 2789STDY5608615]|nr:Uncharacterised protein [Achromobacter sp. 2789STDY5608615]
MKRASARRLNRVRHLAAHRLAVSPGSVQVWNRVQQHPRIRMFRRIEQLVRRRLLHDPAQVHHCHPVRHVAHHRQIVADEHIRQPELLLQIAHQVQDLRLHRHVQRRGRLVAHQELGLRRQRPRDRNALALAARELVRIARRVVRRQAHQRQQILNPAPRLGRRGAQAQRDDGLGHDRAHPPARIQAGVRVLEDHLRMQRAARAAAAIAQRAAGRRHQAHQQLGQRRLAAAGLADDAQRGAARHRQRHAVDRLERLRRLARQGAFEPGRRNVEPAGQVIGPQQDVIVMRHGQRLLGAASRR